MASSKIAVFPEPVGAETITDLSKIAVSINCPPLIVLYLYLKCGQKPPIVRH